jgi:hypothetical protein
MQEGDERMRPAARRDHERHIEERAIHCALEKTSADVLSD